MYFHERLLRINIWLSVSDRPIDLGPNICPQQLFFSGCFERLELIFRQVVFIVGGTEILWRVSLKIIYFFETSCFPWVIGLTGKITFSPISSLGISENGIFTSFLRVLAVKAVGQGIFALRVSVKG